jgi:hypothetical protein
LIAVISLALPLAARPEGLGTFVGRIVTEWQDDGRLMTLLEPFQFVDGSGRKWSVPRGIAVDGASIPSFLWSLTGGPFEGKYRNASIIHDYYCEVRSRRWQEVHRVFYDAMLASGVGQARALLMFKAVEQFGPRWDEPVVDPKCLKPDGAFDFGKCTENSAVRKTEIFWPTSGKEEVLEFLKEVDQSADPDDIRTLRDAIER